MEARVQALAQLAKRFATARRKRSPVEAAPTLTDAYVSLILGCGFARLGEPDASRTAIAEGRAVLGALDDSIHRFLLDLYVARATGDRVSLERLEGDRVGLDRVARFKVDRLLEVSRFLQPARGDDAIATFAGHPTPAIALDAPPMTSTPADPRIASTVERFEREPVEALAAIDRLVREVIDAAMPVQRLTGLLDDFAVAFERLPVARTLAWTATLATGVWPRLTDSFGMNSHYCISVLAGADALVRAVVGGAPS